MLKITEHTEAETIRLSLHGQFTGPYVPNVETALAEIGVKPSKVALDLSNVTFVDRAAMEFLRRTKLKRIRIENPPSYVTRWMEQEMNNTEA